MINACTSLKINLRFQIRLMLLHSYFLPQYNTRGLHHISTSSHILYPYSANKTLAVRDEKRVVDRLQCVEVGYDSSSSILHTCTKHPRAIARV